MHSKCEPILSNIYMKDNKYWRDKLATAPAEDVKTICDSILEIWPASSDAWIKLIELYSVPEEVDNLKQVFEKCLAITQDSKVFEKYLEYIKANKPDDLSSAYEFVLENLFCDPSAGSLWQQYIDHLQSTEANGDWEEQFKMDKVRRAYKKAVSLPLDNVEMLWRKYGQFENKISRLSARKFIDERSPHYMRARQCYKTYQQLQKVISNNTMPDINESKTAWPKWRRIVEFEQQNLLELAESELNERIGLCLKKVQIYARFSEDMWYFCAEASSDDNASMEMLAEGLRALPESALLTFKSATFKESKSDFEGAKQCLYAFIETVISANNDASQGYAELCRFTNRSSGLEAARKVLISAFERLENPTPYIYLAACELERDTPLELHFFKLGFRRCLDKGPGSYPFVYEYLLCLYKRGDYLNARAVLDQFDISSDLNHTENSDVMQTAENEPGTILETNPYIKSIYDLVLSVERVNYRSGLSSSYLQQLESVYASIFKRNDMDMFRTRFDIEVEVEEEVVTKLQQFLQMLPPSKAYDGPSLNIANLMQLIVAKCE